MDWIEDVYPRHDPPSARNETQMEISSENDYEVFAVDRRYLSWGMLCTRPYGYWEFSRPWGLDVPIAEAPFEILGVSFVRLTSGDLTHNLEVWSRDSLDDHYSSWRDGPSVCEGL